MEMTSITEAQVFNGCILFTLATWIWESYLDSRQRAVYRTSKQVPQDMSSLITQDSFDKARSYALDKSTFSFYHGLWSQLLNLGFLYYGAYPWLWSICTQHTVDILGLTTEHEISATMVFMVYQTLFSTVTGLPWGIYSTFVLEQKHGFNQQTVGFFIKDKIKGLMLTFVLGLPITAALIATVQWGGEYFYVYTWLFMTVLILVMMTIYPTWIAPLFDRYEPLPDGALKQGIEALAASLNFPLTKLFVVEGSKRSSHSNAYFFGFWKNKRIVLFDTLIEGFVFPTGDKDKDKDQDKTEDKDKDNDNDNDNDNNKDQTQTSTEAAEETSAEAAEETSADAAEDKTDAKKGCKNDEILAVLGHELGHWYLNHTTYNLLIAEVDLFVQFFLLGFLMNTQVLFTAFGFAANGCPMFLRMMIIFELVLSPVNMLKGFGMIKLSRAFEFQADAFAVGLGRATELASALVKLQNDNKSFPINDWLYSAFNHSHPPLLERLAAMRASAKKQ